jgi:hypothetical protein
MLRGTIIFFAVITLGMFALTSTTSAQTDAKRVEKAAKVKREIQKLGTGARAVAKVKLYDKTEYKGYVSRSGDQDFDITDTAGTAHAVAYADVKSIGGRNLSTGAKIGIGVGIGVGATILAIFIIISHLD